MGWDVKSEVSFKFFYTLWVNRLCICLLIYEIKIVTNILLGFKILCQVGVGGTKFQNCTRYVAFLFLGLKVHMFTGRNWKNFSSKSFTFFFVFY